MAPRSGARSAYLDSMRAVILAGLSEGLLSHFREHVGHSCRTSLVSVASCAAGSRALFAVPVSDDGAVRMDELDRVVRELREAAAGPPEVYALVLERALAACEADQATDEYLDVLELHDELAEAYDRLGRVEDALRHADVLVDRGYQSAPDPRCRRAEILTRHGRLQEAAAIWDEVARDTPDDVWLYNNAGLEYGDIGEHELAHAWLTKGLELAVRTGDPERLVSQLRDLRAQSLAALGREPDRLQTAEPRPMAHTPAPRPRLANAPAQVARSPAGQPPVAWTWLPADEPRTWNSAGATMPTLPPSATRRAASSTMRATAAGWRTGCARRRMPA